MKKIFSFVAAALISATSLFAYDCKVDGIYYNLNSTDLTAEVTFESYGSLSYSGSIVIPSTITYNSQTYSVTTIGGGAFEDCTGLTSVTIPNSVTTIGNYAFYGCTGLTSVTIPNSVTTIGDYAFAYCHDLTSITIPNSVTTIGRSTFEGCSGLTSLTIPNSVTEIGDDAFSSCTGLTSINVDAANTHYCSEDGVLFNYAKDTLIQYPAANTRTEYTIPNSVTTIEDDAFSMCSGLTSITLGNSVTTIGDYAFRWCRGLTSVTIGNSVTTIGWYAFFNCSGLTSITIPNSVTTIGERAFDGCSGLTSVTIGNSVTMIGNGAFEFCSGLKKTNYTGTIADWCKISFESSSSNPLRFSHNFFINDLEVKDLVIPNSVTEIGDYAFYWCIGLTSVTIPNSVTTIGQLAFSSCIGLTSITIPNSVTTIGYGAFHGCEGLTSIEIPNSVTTIEDRAFSGCTGLTSVNIPNSVTTIEDGVFSGCTGLTSVTIPNSVTMIGDYAFSNDTSLTSITCYAVTPPECYENAFKNMSQDTKVYVLAFALADYQNAYGWEDLQLYPIAAEVTPMDDENPVVTPTNQDVTITWPITDGTDTYTLTITKNGETVCVLTFNANGQLTNIAFAAPGHNGAHQAPAATLTTQGYQFTVTGLNPGTSYNYSVIATNAGGRTIAEHKGNFSTTGGTGFESVRGSQCTMHKVLRNGQILLERNNATYTLTGQKVL